MTTDAPMGLRARKKQAQRTAIYETALDNFRERGFADVTVQEICEQTNISLKTFFNYFPSKQAILDECVEQLLSMFVDVFSECRSAENISFEQRLRRLVRQMASALEADPAFWLMIFRDSKLFNASGTIKDEEMQIYQMAADLFADGQAKGELDGSADPFQLAEMFFSIYYFTAMNWLSGWWPKRKDKLNKRLEKALTVFLNGVLVRPD